MEGHAQMFDKETSARLFDREAATTLALRGTQRLDDGRYQFTRDLRLKRVCTFWMPLAPQMLTAYNYIHCSNHYWRHLMEQIMLLFRVFSAQFFWFCKWQKTLLTRWQAKTCAWSALLWIKNPNPSTNLRVFFFFSLQSRKILRLIFWCSFKIGWCK